MTSWTEPPCSASSTQLLDKLQYSNSNQELALSFHFLFSSFLTNRSAIMWDNDVIK